MNDQFDFIKRLGSGYFGEVWLVNDTTLNSRCALKCIPIEKVIYKNNYFHEAQLLKEAEHLNIVKVLSTGLLEDGRIYLAMEYLERGSLEDETKGAFIELSKAKRLMIDVLRGLSHSHQKKIIHRDIKPANILVGDQWEGKLSDFGLALSRVRDLKPSSIKSYHYWIHLAPEVESFDNHSIISDIYACGVTLYRLVNGDSYLSQVPLEKIRGKVQAGEFPDRAKYREFITRPLKLIINKAMSVDPAGRYQSADEMRHALERISLVLNWYEKKLRNGVVWTASHNGVCFLVKRILSEKNKWVVEVKKGSSKKNAKRITRLCREEMDKRSAVSYSRKVLCDLTSGKDSGKR